MLEVNSMSTLTAKEIEVLALIAQGYTDLEMSKKLNNTYYTIRSHVLKIKAKTKISRRTLLGFYAYQNGYVTDDQIKAAMITQR
jgi:DNA-binding CsgD family transcriptional regulator